MILLANSVWGGNSTQVHVSSSPEGIIELLNI